MTLELQKVGDLGTRFLQFLPPVKIAYDIRILIIKKKKKRYILKSIYL